jgi:hypothetical protein
VRIGEYLGNRGSTARLLRIVPRFLKGRRIRSSHDSAIACSDAWIPAPFLLPPCAPDFSPSVLSQKSAEHLEGNAPERTAGAPGQFVVGP